MKYLKIAGIVFLTIMVLGIVLKIFIGYAGHHLFIPFLVKQVDKQTHGRYELVIESDSVELGLTTLSLALGPAEFRRDTSINKNSGIELLDKFDIHGSIHSLKVDLLHPLKFILNKKININQVVLVQPTLVIRKNLLYSPDEEKESTSERKIDEMIYTDSDSVLADTTAWKEFKQSGAEFLPYLKLEKFSIEGASFSFYDGRKKYPVNEVHGLDFQATGFLYDGKADVSLEDVGIYLDSASTLVSKNLARLQAKQVSLRPESVELGNLHFKHIIDRYQINRIRGFRSSWLDFEVSDIDIRGLRPETLINDSILYIDCVSIGNLRLSFFKDKSDPVINPAYKALPPEKIRNIPVKLKVDTVDILQGDLIIEMESPDAKLPGRITLNQFQATITNITNMPDYLSRNPEMVLNARFAVMDSARINLASSFKIDSPDDQFRVSCEVSPFNVAILNGFLGSQFFIDFSSGMIRNLHFEFEGNNKANVGTMDLEYRNLRIKRFQDFRRYIDSKPNTGFIAFLGNALIPNNRSREDKNYKTAVIYYEKDYNRDFIHGTIMSLLSGVSSSLGFGSKDLEKKEERASELDDTSLQKSAEKAVKEAEKAEKKVEEAEKKEP